MDAELTLTPENMAALELDEEFWAAVSPDEKPPVLTTKQQQQKDGKD